MKISKLVFTYLCVMVMSFLSANSEAASVKPNVNIGVLGTSTSKPRDFGESLFANAIGRSPASEDFIRAGEITYVEYESDKVHFAQALFQNGTPKNYGQFYQALQSLDGAVFIVEKTKIDTREMLDQCLSVKAAGVPKIFVYLVDQTKTQTNSKRKLYSFFSGCGYSSESVRIVQGEIIQQKNGASSYSEITTLFNLLSSELRPRTQNVGAEFVLPIDDIFSISGRGTIVTGRVNSGQISIGDELVVIGEGKELRTKVKDIEMFRKKLTLARAGDHVGITLQDVSRGDIARGMVLAKPNIARQATTFPATLTFPSKLGIGRKNLRSRSDKYTLFTGSVSLSVNVRFIGDQSVMIDAPEPIPNIYEWPFILRQKNEAAAIGIFK